MRRVCVGMGGWGSPHYSKDGVLKRNVAAPSCDAFGGVFCADYQPSFHLPVRRSAEQTVAAPAAAPL